METLKVLCPEPKTPDHSLHYFIRGFRLLGHDVTISTEWKKGTDLCFFQTYTNFDVDGIDWERTAFWLTDIESYEPINQIVLCNRARMVFVAHQNYLPWARALNPRVEYLPAAADPDIHRPMEDVEEDHDIAFVGGIAHPARLALLKRLYDAKFRLLVYCQYKIEPDPPFPYIAERQVHEDLSRAYARAPLAFNYMAPYAGINMRIFETLAMERVLLTNQFFVHGGLLEPDTLFQHWKHLVVYDEVDFETRVRQLLEDDYTRMRIAKEVRKEVLQKHTYLHRCKQVIDDFYRVVEEK